MSITNYVCANRRFATLDKAKAHAARLFATRGIVAGIEVLPATWLQAEEYAYPNGGQTRKGSAMFPDGRVRRVWAGIPDTFWTIPAHARVNGRYVAGYLDTAESGALRFNISKATKS